MNMWIKKQKTQPRSKLCLLYNNSVFAHNSFYKILVRLFVQAFLYSSFVTLFLQLSDLYF